MPGTSKKISDLNAIATMHDTDLVEVSNDNQDSTYTSVKATIGDVAEHVAKTTEFTNDLDTADKTLVGAINEVAGDIPTTVAELTDASDYATVASLAAVATSGDYGDLLNQPTIPAAQVNSDWDAVSGVAQILNKPTIPAAQVNSDWNSASGVSQILNKPTLATVATSGAYSDLSGTPTFATVATSGLYSDLSGTPTLATVATSGSYNDLSNQPTIPDSLSGLTGDVNISSPTDGQVLKYDNATSKWVNGTSGGGGASALDDLTDVDITTPTDGQVLKYDAANDEWINGTGGGGSNSVELTYAEYQALTPEQQLDGTEYFITDINGDGQQFQPICYSETEREIGVWIDGKPLYEKTVNTGALPDTTTKTVAHSVSDIGTIIDIRGYAYDSNTGYIPLEFFNVAGLQYGTTVYADDTNIILSTTSNRSSFAESYITLRYTKTTDQAGSGTWTPQGVPAHHYSNNEQVIGTWIDGKTVYEKTVSFATPSSNAYTSQNLGVLTADIDNIWLAEGHAIGANYIANVAGYTGNPTNDEFMGFIYKNNPNITFDYRVGSSLQNGNAYLTIRYTKSST